MYPGGMISYNNIDKTYGLTVSECREWCTSYSSVLCRNVEFQVSTTACSLNHVTATDVSAAWRSGQPDWDFYQRDCA